jgi:hypothetical protein
MDLLLALIYLLVLGWVFTAILGIAFPSIHKGYTRATSRLLKALGRCTWNALYHTQRQKRGRAFGILHVLLWVAIITTILAISNNTFTDNWEGAAYLWAIVLLYALTWWHWRQQQQRKRRLPRRRRPYHPYTQRRR